MTDHNKTVARTIRMYPHEWALIDKRCKQLNKELEKGQVGVNRLIAISVEQDCVAKWYDPVDILSHTDDARAKDAKRRKREAR